MGFLMKQKYLHSKISNYLINRITKQMKRVDIDELLFMLCFECSTQVVLILRKKIQNL